MERIFCDKCGREIFISDLDVVQVNISITGSTHSERNYSGFSLDFHKKCAEEWRNEILGKRQALIRITAPSVSRESLFPDFGSEFNRSSPRTPNPLDPDFEAN